jgi:integrase
MATRKRGDSWQADFMVKGERYRETFDTEPEARAWELEARAALIAGKPLPPVRNAKTPTGGGLHTLGALLDHVETSHWRNNPKIKAPDTAVGNARKAVEFFGRNTLVSTITTDEMKRLVQHTVAEGHTLATADRRLAALSKMLKIAAEKGVIPRTPPVPLSRETNERVRFLTRPEAHQLLALWLEWQQPELHAFTVFGLHCGARLNALLEVRWSHFGPGYESVYFAGGDKKSLPRTLPMSKAAINAVQTMRQLHPAGTGPFAHFKKDGHLRTMWDRMQAHLGFDDVVVHTLRHTCATWLYEATRDIKRVQTWLGHRRIEQTLMYAKLVPGALDSMADIMDKALGEQPRLRVVGE